MPVRALGLGLIAAMALPAPASAINIGFTLVNDSLQSVTEFDLAKPGSGELGDNVLNTGPLPSGASGRVSVFDAEGCVFDLRIVYEEGGVVEDKAVDICKLADEIYVIPE
jgi:hypothetical protein